MNCTEIISHRLYIPLLPDPPNVRIQLGRKRAARDAFCFAVPRPLAFPFGRFKEPPPALNLPTRHSLFESPTFL